MSEAKNLFAQFEKKNEILRRGVYPAASGAPQNDTTQEFFGSLILYCLANCVYRGISTQLFSGS
jgi:hypothetical protein